MKITQYFGILDQFMTYVFIDYLVTPHTPFRKPLKRLDLEKISPH